MWSVPGSYLTLSLNDTNGDTQAPAITVTAPAESAVLLRPAHPSPLHGELDLDEGSPGVGEA